METLSFVDVENATTVESMELGTVASKSSEDFLLRVVNKSDAFQAKDVEITVGGADALQLWLSTDGESYGPSINVGTVAPGATSPVFWLRRVTPSDASVGEFDATLTAAPAGWTASADTSASDNVPIGS